MSAKLQSIAGCTSLAFDGHTVAHEGLSVILSKRQAEMFGVLYRHRYDDRFIGSDEINAALGRNVRAGRIGIFLGAKLRRIRLALETRCGRGGGYRLRELAA